MFNYTSDDIYTAFEAAPNLNSALKNFLKREIRKGDPAEKFVKSLRKLAGSGNAAAMKAFFEKSLPVYHQHILLLAGYANADAVNAISETVIEAHAETFNETYDTSEDGISIKDREGFESIVGNVDTMLSNGIKEHGLPESPFMKLVLVNSIFEDQVMAEVVPLLFD